MKCAEAAGEPLECTDGLPLFFHHLGDGADSLRKLGGQELDMGPEELVVVMVADAIVATDGGHEARK